MVKLIRQMTPQEEITMLRKKCKIYRAALRRGKNVQHFSLAVHGDRVGYTPDANGMWVFGPNLEDALKYKE